MRKILFISDFILASEQGAKQSSIAHYQTLKDIFGENNVDVVALNTTYNSENSKILFQEKKRNKIDKALNIVLRMPFLMSPKAGKKILELCKINKYLLIFVDHSIYGDIVKKIKLKYKIPVISYFHGIMQYQNLQYKISNKTSIFYNITCSNMNRNEGKTVKYSDAILVLNSRDNANLKKYYGVSSEYMLPVYYRDTAKIDAIEISEKLELLFVGGYFWPNIHGISWFVKKVMPQLSKIYILRLWEMEWISCLLTYYLKEFEYMEE